MSLESRISRQLRKIEDLGRAREIKVAGNPTSSRIDLSSNDYLGLAADPRVILACTGRDNENTPVRLGTSSSRVLAPPLEAHAELEDGLSRFLGMEDALLFGSGYLANIGVLSAVINRNDIICSDQFIHASLIDGILLSRGRHYRYKHNCMSALENLLKHLHVSRRPDSEIFIVTESVFSMDGDRAPLTELSDLARRYNANLIIDEAHAIGVFGKNGRGLHSEIGNHNPNTILLGTLSKSLGSYGGFVATSNVLKRYLISRARSFLFSTALPELAPRGALKALEIINADETLGPRLIDKADFLRQELNKHEVPIIASDTHIQPVHIGDERDSLALSRHLLLKGIRISAIRPPTVPAKTSRLRCSLSLSCEDYLLLEAANEIASWLKAQRQ